MSEIVANEAIELAERCAREAWPALLEFDRAVAMQVPTRLEWHEEPDDRRLEAIEVAALIIGGATVDELFRHLGRKEGQRVLPNTLARAIMMKNIVAAIAARETTSEVANRALREREKIRTEVGMARGLLRKSHRDAGLHATHVHELTAIVERLSELLKA